MKKREIVELLKKAFFETDIQEQMDLFFKEKEIKNFNHFEFSVDEYNIVDIEKTQDFSKYIDFEELIFDENNELLMPFNPLIIDTLLQKMTLDEYLGGEFANHSKEIVEERKHRYLNEYLGENYIYFFKYFNDSDAILLAQFSKRYFETIPSIVGRANIVVTTIKDLYNIVFNNINKNFWSFQMKGTHVGNDYFFESVDINEMNQKAKNMGQLQFDMGKVLAFNSYQFIKYLLGFLQELNKPTNVLIERSLTDKRNQILEWRLNNSHYLLIDKDILASKNDETICELSGKFTRQSLATHSRRGHFRILKHERYKNNIGKRIWISDTWVGPTEWKGTDNKFYKIVSKKQIPLENDNSPEEIFEPVQIVKKSKLEIIVRKSSRRKKG